MFLGWGHFSTVWLAQDREKEHLVAVKINKSKKKYSNSAILELKNLQKIRLTEYHQEKKVVTLFECFELNGPNGMHVCMVFEVLGQNMLNHIIDREKELERIEQEEGKAKDRVDQENSDEMGNRKCLLFPLTMLKQWTKDLLEGLSFLHDYCDLIHTDIKPENVALTVDEFCDNGSKKKRKVLKIIDLGNSVRKDKTSYTEITTRQYRAPEVILGYKYTSAVDIWSTACLIFEMATGDVLFTPKESCTKSYSKDDDHLAQMIELLNPIPYKMKFGGKKSKLFFDARGKLRRIEDFDYWSLDSVLHEKYNMSPKDAKEMSNFLNSLLQYEPDKRITAFKALNSPWLREVR